jgi:hypothetical protein
MCSRNGANVAVHERNDVTIARSRKRELRSERGAAVSCLFLAVSSGSASAVLPSVVIIGHCCYVSKCLPQTRDCFPSIWFKELYFGDVFVCVGICISAWNT